MMNQHAQKEVHFDHGSRKCPDWSKVGPQPGGGGTERTVAQPQRDGGKDAKIKLLEQIMTELQTHNVTKDHYRWQANRPTVTHTKRGT